MKYKQFENTSMIFPENDMYFGKIMDTDTQYFKIKFLEDLLSEGDVVIDVGANIGILTIPLAKKVGKKGYVLALESHTMFFNTLCGNIALNELTQVQAFNRAAADKSGSMFYFPHFNLSDVEDFSSIKLSGLLNYKDDKERLYDNPVAAIAVDDLGISTPKLIKISISGMEPVALNGMKKTIKRSKPLLYIQFSQNWKYILDYLNSIDYEWILQETPLLDSKEMNLFCWSKSNKPQNIDYSYVVDLNNSQDPNHLEIKRIVEEKNKPKFSVDQ